MLQFTKLLRNFKLMHRLGKVDDAFIEVVELLTKLRDDSAELTVTPGDSVNEFKSVLTAINLRHRVMVIDTPSADEFVSALSPGEKLTVSADSQGRPIKFQSRFIEPFLPNPDFGLQLEMPSFLGLKQQRGAFRVFLEELGQHVGITLLDDKAHRIDGVVRNISRSGVGVKTVYDFPDEISVPESKLGCLIQLADESIACQMEVRNVSHLANGQNSTYVGGRMLGISRQDANRLEEFIRNLIDQRMQTLLAQY